MLSIPSIKSPVPRCTELSPCVLPVSTPPVCLSFSLVLVLTFAQKNKTLKRVPSIELIRHVIDLTKVKHLLAVSRSLMTVKDESPTVTPSRNAKTSKPPPHPPQRVKRPLSPPLPSSSVDTPPGGQKRNLSPGVDEDTLRKRRNMSSSSPLPSPAVLDTSTTKSRDVEMCPPSPPVHLRPLEALIPPVETSQARQARLEHEVNARRRLQGRDGSEAAPAPPLSSFSGASSPAVYQRLSLVASTIALPRALPPPPSTTVDARQHSHVNPPSNESQRSSASSADAPYLVRGRRRLPAPSVDRSYSSSPDDPSSYCPSPPDAPIGRGFRRTRPLSATTTVPLAVRSNASTRRGELGQPLHPKRASTNRRRFRRPVSELGAIPSCVIAAARGEETPPGTDSDSSSSDGEGLASLAAVASRR